MAHHNEETMSSEERFRWLRERGVLIETREERKLKQIRDIMSENDEDGKYDDLYFVHIPQNESLPLRELVVRTPITGTGDILLEHVRTFFQALTNKADMSLLKEQAAKQFGSSEIPSTLSEEALAQVAEEGHVEVFCLVHSVPSNHFTSINVYLDELGMLKRLPINTRAGELAKRVGFNPEPIFYGDVFVGRLITKPVLKNVHFRLNDSLPQAEWLQNAISENLQYQRMLNAATGNTNMVQPPVDGSDGVSKVEENFSWTQTRNEIEITVHLKDLPSNLSSKDVKVNFSPRKIKLSVEGSHLFSITLFDNVDPDGSTWTFDRSQKAVVITCEKVSETMWPRAKE